MRDGEDVNKKRTEIQGKKECPIPLPVATTRVVVDSCSLNWNNLTMTIVRFSKNFSGKPQTLNPNPIPTASKPMSVDTFAT